MIYQISSGQGPAECELAVAKLLHHLERQHALTVLSRSAGREPGTLRSVRFSTDADLSSYEGSVQWICPSPFRPHHRRKNWFIDFSLCAEARSHVFDPEQVAFRTMHSGGKGGQNVNKVETGVQAVYLPTGDTVECTEERSQYQNRQTALRRLRSMTEERNAAAAADARNGAWQRHTDLQRGGARVVFTGPEFNKKR